MKFTFEGEAQDITLILEAVVELFPSSSLPVTQDQGNEAVSEPITRERDAPPSPEAVQAGSASWYGLIELWEQGFGQDLADQPNRTEALLQTMNQHSSDVFAFLRYCDGLTRAVVTCFPHMDRKRARQIAENVAQVASAMGIPGIADHLEYPYPPQAGSR